MSKLFEANLRPTRRNPTPGLPPFDPNKMNIGNDYKEMKFFIERQFPRLELAIQQYEQKMIALNKNMREQADKIATQHADQLSQQQGELSIKDKEIREKTAEVEAIKKACDKRVSQAEETLNKLKTTVDEFAEKMKGMDFVDKFGASGGKTNYSLFFDKTHKAIQELQSSNAENEKQYQDLLTNFKRMEDNASGRDSEHVALQKKYTKLQGEFDSATNQKEKLIKEFDKIQEKLESNLGKARQATLEAQTMYNNLLGEVNKMRKHTATGVGPSITPEHIQNYGTFNLMEYLEKRYLEEKNNSK